MKYSARLTLLIFSIVIAASGLMFNVNSYIKILLFVLIVYLVGYFLDKRLFEKHEKEHLDLIEFAPEAIFIYQNEKIVYANRRFEELLQLNSNEILGKSIFDFILPEFHSVVEKRIEMAEAGLKNVERSELKMRSAQGQIIEIEASSVLINYKNKPSLEVILKDISLLSALMLDIDYFKRFNDCYGHQAGDDCLKAVAATIKETFTRPGDFFARYGGEEFVVLLPETDEKEAVLLAERLLRNIRNLDIRTVVSEVADIVTISVGCAAVVPRRHDEPQSLIKMADDALYLAKKSGRNTVKIAVSS